MTFVGDTALDGGSHSYGSRSGMKFVMDNVACSGDESLITDCSYSRRSDCSLQNEVAAVRCSTGKIQFQLAILDFAFCPPPHFGQFLSCMVCT